MNEITCRFCGTTTAAGTTTCPSCGSRLSAGSVGSCLTLIAIVVLLLAALPLAVGGGCAVLVGSGEPHAWQVGGVAFVGTAVLLAALGCAVLGIGLCVAYARRRFPRTTPRPPSGDDSAA